MDYLGSDIGAGGRVLSKEEVIEQRERAGKCITCGTKCFEKTFFKRAPLTIPGKVLNGRCLHCHPQDPSTEEIIEASCAPAGSIDSYDACVASTSARSLSASISSSMTEAQKKMANKFSMAAVKRSFSHGKPSSEELSEELEEEPSRRGSTLSDRSSTYLRRMTPRPSSLIGDLEDAAKAVQQQQELDEQEQVDGTGRSSISSISSNGAYGYEDDRKMAAFTLTEKDALEALNQPDIAYTDIINIMMEIPQSLAVMNEGLHGLSLIHEPDSKMLQEAVENGGFDVIVNAMEACAVDNMAQINACKVIFIACLGGELQQLAFAKAGAARALETALKSFGDDTIVLEGILLALSSLCLAEENIKYILDGDLVNEVVSIMNLNVDNGGLQEHGFNILENLASNDEARRRVINCGGLDIFVISMAVNLDDTDVQCQAMAAVRAFCDRDADSMILMAQSGAVDAVLETMKTHPDDTEVQEKAIQALATFSKHPDNRTLLIEAGAIAAVLEAMQEHASTPEIQSEGCETLSNLASDDDDDTKVRIVSELALDIVVMAMVLHGDNTQIQERAVILLRKLCIKENIQRMVAANVSPVITVTAETLPSLIEETSYIVAQLENA